jgi:hypothetical protein
MSNALLNNYVRLFESLPIDTRLSLLTALTESLRSSFTPPSANRKRELFNRLAGAWSDVDGDAMIEDIYASRTISDRDLSFDD